ncbi:MAG TPA: CDP-alcohol phosphatidyltransferase family protein [Vicinamibacterales bacterium]|nr:CDP-alcohol phosphatidyltransferase family protein [Vicinamibacterales bacterium]
MRTTVWRLPDAPLRASAVSAKLVGLCMVVSLAAAARTGLPVSGLYAWKAPAAFALTMLVALGFLQEHHPFAQFGAANQVTTIRALLVALIVGLVGELRVPVLAAAAVAGSVIVTALDGVDGWLARRHRIASPYGARFDMEVDALLILALSILAWRFEKAGVWVIASGVMRYAFVAAGFVWTWLQAPLPPSRRRQTVCVVQVAALTVALIPFVTPPVSSAVAVTALAALAYSFSVDLLWLWRRAA